MANSAGGVIIYGISETAAGHLPEMIDPVNRDAFSKRVAGAHYFANPATDRRSAHYTCLTFF